jgi:protein SCO1/2
MTRNHSPVDRRTFVRGTAAVAAGALAGCSAFGGDSDRTPTSGKPVSLDPPENYENLREADVGYPIYGEKLPAATLQAPLSDTELSTREFVGERLTLLTFIYTRCGSICPALTVNLVQVQADAAERGYSADVALFPITFDPEHDHAEELREFGEDRGADVSADNWHFLRPDGPERVQEVVVDTFGHPFQENPDEEGMPFLHNPLLVLANERGYVERAYANTVPDASTVLDDVRQLVGE